MSMTEQEIIQQKVELTQMQLGACDSPQAILDLLRNSLDEETVLYTVQLNAIGKIADIIVSLDEQNDMLKRQNEQLKVNNAILAGVADSEEKPELTQEEKEYMAVMNDSTEE